MSRYLLHTVEYVLSEPVPILPVACRDLDDIVFVQPALVAKADVLVTGDDDLLTLRGNVLLRIVTVSESPTILG